MAPTPLGAWIIKIDDSFEDLFMFSANCYHSEFSAFEVDEIKFLFRFSSKLLGRTI